MAWCEARGCRLPVRPARPDAGDDPEGGARRPRPGRQRRCCAERTGKAARLFRDFGLPEHVDLLVADRWRSCHGQEPSTSCPTVPIRVSSVTSLGREKIDARSASTKICYVRHRGEMENRIKECQARPVRRPHVDLAIHAGQRNSRLWFAVDGLSVLLLSDRCARIRTLRHTQFADASTCGTIRS